MSAFQDLPENDTRKSTYAKGKQTQQILTNTFKEVKITDTKFFKSFEKLSKQYPNIFAEWDKKKNKFDPSHVITLGSKYYWWLTPYDDPKTGKHFDFSWKATLRQRINNRKCPYIDDLKVYSGFNDLKTRCPRLMKEWDYNKNTLNPSNILWKTTKKAWWICPRGHSYETRISHRTNLGKPSSCPYCCNPPRKILAGFNDLCTTNPELLKEWDYNRNPIKPNQVSKGYSKKVWWKCKLGHSYKQMISYRVNAINSGKFGTCPYCSNQKLLPGFNDLATRYPELLKEWDFNKNKIKPNQIMPGTRKKVWWKCPFGHSYSSYFYNKIGINHSDCPICDKENHTSFPEQAIYFYVKQEFPDAINSDQDTIGMELDIYIPSKRTAIEYDGFEWHRKHLKRDAKKDALCKQNGIRLIRIREGGLPAIDDSVNITVTTSKELASLASSIQEIFKLLNKSNHVKINLEKDATNIYESYIKSRKSKSLLKLFPDIAKEWHPTKNGRLLPSMVSYGTQKKCGGNALTVMNTEWKFILEQY